MEAGARADLADRDKRRPLHWAADRAAEGCVKILLEAGVEFDAVDWAGYTALHYAARRSANGCVQLLLGAGADHRLLAMNGELAEDLAGESATKTLLKETGGSMKRRRSLSSGDSHSLSPHLTRVCPDDNHAWPRPANRRPLIPHPEP